MESIAGVDRNALWHLALTPVSIFKVKKTPPMGGVFW
jgi:hypothetical protein